MLVLSRKKDEKIMIGEDVTLMVIEIRGDKVRLGIDAPKGRLRPPRRGVQRDPPRAGRGAGSKPECRTPECRAVTAAVVPRRVAERPDRNPVGAFFRMRGF